MRTMQFVNFVSLPKGAQVDVETKNRLYHIEYLGGDNIRISGHPDYCPAPVKGHLLGSSDKAGSLEPGLIETGRYLRFVLEDERPVQTSRVTKLRVDQPQADSGVSASSSASLS